MSKIVVTITIAVAVWYITVAAAKNSGQESIVTGEDIYRLNCASCHGADRSGSPPHYPSLLDIKGRLSKGEVRQWIENGKNRMPAFSYLMQPEKDALVAFLFDEKAQTVEISSENLGERIFKSNCSSCHRATINDPKLPNVWMMEPAPLAGATKRFTRDEFFRILETGICYMPSFDHFTSSEREALYSFVKSLEGKGEPSRPTMAEMCPMMMRMRRRK